MIRGLTAGLFASSLLAFAAGADTLATRDMPVRIELHPLQTLPLTDQQFLAGDKAGAKATTLGGELSIAQGEGRLPVVILMHGSGGAGGNIGYWRRQLHPMGISTFVIDGMTGRRFANHRTRPRSGASTSSSTCTGRWRCWRSTRGSIRSASP